MHRRLASILLLSLVSLPAGPAAARAMRDEPPARRPAAVPLTLAAPLPHVSAVRRLPDGRLLVTDARTPAISLVNTDTGIVTRVGSPGAGDRQYVQPGGIYGGPDGASLVLDRGLQRALVIDSRGAIARTYSIARRGTTTATDADLDLHRLDAHGRVYFVDLDAGLLARMRGDAAAGAVLVRFDPASQTGRTVARLREVESQTIPGGDGVTFRRGVIGSPADGYGVAPDGQVAVVRASPYQVEWHTLDGGVTRGAVITADALPMTDADRQAYEARRRAGPSVGTGGAAGRGTSADLGLQFAPTKPPFEPDDVTVSPAGQVWVRRTAAFGATTVIYDVFDRTGARVDRLAFDAQVRVVGFGTREVFVREAVPGGVTLKAFRTR